jgi:uncharacterized protein (DUF362 family)
MEELLALLEYRPKRDALFVKPNVADAGPSGRGLFTDPCVVQAFLACVPYQTAVIGEGCIVGADADVALRSNGFGRLAGTRVSLVNLDNASREEVPWRFGCLRMPRLLSTHEYVNIAKMKTHIQTGVTLGLKNQKGLLAATDKRRFHRMGLHQCITALGEAVRPALTIVDGIVALEGDGPWRYGHPVAMNVLVGGTDTIEVDSVCLRLMGFPPDHARHIPALKSVRTVGASVSELTRSFLFSYQGFFRYKNVFEHIHDSCSGCNRSLYEAFRAMKRNRWRRLRFQYRGVWRRLDIVMGHAHTLPTGHGKVVCMGDCAAEFAEEHRLPFAGGCPPPVNAVLRVI